MREIELVTGADVAEGEAPGPPLPRAFYERPTLEVARALIGKTLVKRTALGVAAGTIVETEGYIAAIDPAAHGYRRYTHAKRAMFGPAAHAYVYRSYGIHVCVNIVTEGAGEAAAVLVRALVPTSGLAAMRARRGPSIADRDLCRGPGRLCEALGITMDDDGADLLAPDLYVTETPGFPADPHIVATTRIGITKGMDLPWRYLLAGSSYVSRGIGRRAAAE